MKSSQRNLCCQATDSSSCFSIENLVFARMNLKTADLKNVVFDWEMCFHPSEVYRFRNLVGIDLQIKYTQQLHTVNKYFTLLL